MKKPADRRNNKTSAPNPAPAENRRSGRDRRVNERVVVDWPVDYGDHDTYLFSYLSDISTMGIFVQTPQPSPAGTQLSLRFTPPGQPKMKLNGKVVWVNPPAEPFQADRQPGMGIQFIDVTDAQKDQLQMLIQKLAMIDEDWVE